MIRILKNKLITFLFRILDVPAFTPTNKDDKQMQRWLSDCWQDRGFIVYSRERARQLQRTLAEGVGMKEHPRDDYVRMTGQRFEHANFMLRCKKAY